MIPRAGVLALAALAGAVACSSTAAEETANSASADSSCQLVGNAPNQIEVCGEFLAAFNAYQGPYPRVGLPLSRSFEYDGDRFQIFERVVMNAHPSGPCAGGLACIALIGTEDAKETLGKGYDGSSTADCAEQGLSRRSYQCLENQLGGDPAKAAALHREMASYVPYYGAMLSAVQPTCAWWNDGDAPVHADCFWTERAKVGRAPNGDWETEALGKKRLAHNQIPGAPPTPSTNDIERAQIRAELTNEGHVVLDDVPDEATLRDIVVRIPDGRWERGNSYYAILDDGRIFYKSWLYLVQITAWEAKIDKGILHRPTRARIVGATARATNSWLFADGLLPPGTSTAVVLGTWESEAKNALSMKWIPSQLPLGAVVLPSKQTFESNFTAGQPDAYAGLIVCNDVLTEAQSRESTGYDERSTFNAAPACNDAHADRDNVLKLYHDELGQSARPSLIVGISAGTFVAQHLAEDLGGVETHLFGTPRYACKAGSGVGCDDALFGVHAADFYKDQDSQMPYCENGPTLPLFPYVFYRNNPHDRVPGSFDNAPQILGANSFHDYSNWAPTSRSGQDRFERTDYEACGYTVSPGGHPDCGSFPSYLRESHPGLSCCDLQGCR